jgi:hypothetical protein
MRLIYLDVPTVAENLMRDVPAVSNVPEPAKRSKATKRKANSGNREQGNSTQGDSSDEPIALVVYNFYL